LEGLYVLPLNIFSRLDSNFPDGQLESRQKYVSGWIIGVAQKN